MGAQRAAPSGAPTSPILGGEGAMSTSIYAEVNESGHSTGLTNNSNEVNINTGRLLRFADFLPSELFFRHAGSLMSQRNRFLASRRLPFPPISPLPALQSPTSPPFSSMPTTPNSASSNLASSTNTNTISNSYNNNSHNNPFADSAPASALLPTRPRTLAFEWNTYDKTGWTFAFVSNLNSLLNSASSASASASTVVTPTSAGSTPPIPMTDNEGDNNNNSDPNPTTNNPSPITVKDEPSASATASTSLASSASALSSGSAPVPAATVTVKEEESMNGKPITNSVKIEEDKEEEGEGEDERKSNNKRKGGKKGIKRAKTKGSKDGDEKASNSSVKSEESEKDSDPTLSPAAGGKSVKRQRTDKDVPKQRLMPKKEKEDTEKEEEEGGVSLQVFRLTDFLYRQPHSVAAELRSSLITLTSGDGQWSASTHTSSRHTAV